MSPKEEVDDSLLDEGRLHDGQRVGRYIVVRDMEGTACAVSAGAVNALRETESGTLLMLSGGKMLEIPRAMRTVLAWLDGRG